MPEPATSDRPLPGRQREARSNDVAVLAAAREVLSTKGHDASIADIARHAGVGVGSIYRRYATKEALVEALHLHAVKEAASRTTELARELEKGAEVDDGAVVAFLARQITGAGGPILRPPRMAGPIPTELAAASDELGAGLEALIAHDRAAGLVPAGLTAADVMQLLQHLRPALPLPRADADALHLRYLDLIAQGLRAQADAGVVLDAGPGWDEWVGAWHG
ncbi:TetR/AcrR family transcriptional regulator [Microbacterium sp. NPDC056234]|uniref:TetR/AcrR family transcriptional regulator n=1 Tax=Microbacterium sp. NPDC056234 TaxID=3345757 RepID=UPI0035DE5030